MSKKQENVNLHRILGLPVRVSEGGTIPKYILDEIARIHAPHIDWASSQKQDLAKQLVEAAGLKWDNDWNSKGSTIKGPGWTQVRQALQEFIKNPTEPKPPRHEGPLGEAYENVDVDAIDDEKERVQSEIDLAKQAESTKLHMETQNELADALRNKDIEPLKPKSGEPHYDLAWKIGDVEFICEVKSVNKDNRSHQFRLGIGQVIEFAHFVSEIRGSSVSRILLLSQTPTIDEVAVALSARIVLIGRDNIADFVDSITG